MFYIAAHFVGGTIGVLLVVALLGQAFTELPVHYVATVPGPAGVWIALGAEFVIAGGLMFTILSVMNSRRYARLTGVSAGILVATYITFEAPLSGMSMNPARTIASSAPSGIWEHTWIYFVAPVFGMLTGAELYRAVTHRASVKCAKLDHTAHKRCIHCGYEPMDASVMAEGDVCEPHHDVARTVNIDNKGGGHGRSSHD